MSCGILPTSSPGVGAFPGLPGRFVPLPASFVSLWMLLRIRGFCVFEFGNSPQQQPVWSHVFVVFLYFEFISKLANDQASTAQQILFRGVMTPTLLPVRPGLHSTDVGLLGVCHCHCHCHCLASSLPFTRRPVSPRQSSPSCTSKSCHALMLNAQN